MGVRRVYGSVEDVADGLRACRRVVLSRRWPAQAAAAVPSLRARTPPRIPPILLPHHSVLHFLPLMGGQ